MLQMSVRRDYGTSTMNGWLTSPSSPDQLRRWLAGRWALLFSHPDDFANYGFETDRWLVYLQSAFDSLRLRPIAIGYDDGSGWVSQTGGRFIPNYEISELVPQLRSCTQPKAGQSAAEHFVTILDATARARRTMLYSPSGEIPSVIELAHTAAHLRERSVPASVRRILQSV
jgi:hypothetical protein